MSSFKETIRRRLARGGWFLRRRAGLPAGVEFDRDFLVRAGLAAPKVIFDVGAHCGETAGRFAADFPGARICSFEPVQASYLALRDAAHGWPNVECYPLALGDQEAEIEIALQADSQTNTLRAPASGSLEEKTEKIKVTTIDAFTAANAVSAIDLLKIDTEGYELAVLSGANRMLTDHAVGSVFVEASLDPDDRFHTPLPNLVEALSPFGFRLAAIYDQVIWQSPVRLAYFNAFFVLDRAP